MKKGKGRLVYNTSQKGSEKVWLHISLFVHRDSAWPFDRVNQPVDVEICDSVIHGGPCLLIKPLPKKEGEDTGKRRV